MSASNNIARAMPPSSLACIPCRKKHLKCDAKMPSCTRCESRNAECTYVGSRRGYRGPRRNATGKDDEQSVNSTGEGQAVNYQTLLPISAFSSSDAAMTNDFGMNLTNFDQNSKIYERSPPSLYSEGTMTISRDLIPEGDPRSPKCGDFLIDIFYQVFFPAHPFILPQNYCQKNVVRLPYYVKDVMRFVASHYFTMFNSEAMDRVASSILSNTIQEDGFKVQGLLLFGMALFARFEQARGVDALEQAIDLALRIGMNRKDFAIQQSGGNVVLEESWRRTWWELYIVDGLIAAMTGSTYISRLAAVESDVLLPGPCKQYVDCGPILAGSSLYEMQNRFFAEEEHSWSSFAYKIEAMRIMNTVLLVKDNFSVSDPHVDAIDASISNFLLSLPPDKSDIIERDGLIDEVLFGAHMIIHWASMCLHRPRSNLVFIKRYYATACASEESLSLPVLSYASHTSKAIRAANDLSRLTAIQTPLSAHTPCYTCAIAQSATIHLPAYALQSTIGDSNAIKERLQLAVSALAAIGEVWPLARVVKAQIAQFAREIFLKSTPASSSSTSTSGFQAQMPLWSTPAPLPQIDFESVINNDQWLRDLCQSNDPQNDLVVENVLRNADQEVIV